MWLSTDKLKHTVDVWFNFTWPGKCHL